MRILLWCFGLCVILWLICYLGTGSDEKNIRSFYSYPAAVQERLRGMESYRDRIPSSLPKVFLSNLILFTVVLCIPGYFLKRTVSLEPFL